MEKGRRGETTKRTCGHGATVPRALAGEARGPRRGCEILIQFFHVSGGTGGGKEESEVRRLDLMGNSSHKVGWAWK